MPFRKLPLRSATGQGTVEYVALILLVAGLLAAVVTFAGTPANGRSVGTAIVKKVEDAIKGTGARGR